MYPNRFEYFAPASLEEALSLLSTYQDEAKLLAGGQSLLSLMKLRLANPKYLVDLGRIADLNYIRKDGDAIVIGALTTYAEIHGSDLLRKNCALLPKTASVVGDVQVRNRGTIGGSLAHADPAGDLPAAIVALDAQIKAVSPRRQRWLEADEFFLGFLTTALEPDEIVTEIRLPVLKETNTAYLKAARTKSGFAIAGIAVCLKLDSGGSVADVAVAVTGVGDKAYRARNVENALKGKKPEIRLIEQAASGVVDGIDVTENINGTKEYRSHLARVYTVRAIEAALQS